MLLVPNRQRWMPWLLPVASLRPVSALPPVSERPRFSFRQIVLFLHGVVVDRFEGLLQIFDLLLLCTSFTIEVSKLG